MTMSVKSRIRPASRTIGARRSGLAPLTIRVAGARCWFCPDVARVHSPVAPFDCVGHDNRACLFQVQPSLPRCGIAGAGLL